MSRETGVAVYFWTMLVCGIWLSFSDRTVEASINLAAAAIIGVMNLNSRDRE